MNTSTMLDFILGRLENRAMRLHNVTQEKARLVSEALTVDRKMCSLMAELEAVKAEHNKALKDARDYEAARDAFDKLMVEHNNVVEELKITRRELMETRDALELSRGNVRAVQYHETEAIKERDAARAELERTQRAVYDLAYNEKVNAEPIVIRFNIVPGGRAVLKDSKS